VLFQYIVSDSVGGNNFSGLVPDSMGGVI